MARETSGEKAAIQSLTSRLEEAGQREKDLQDRITAIEGWPTLCSMCQCNQQSAVLPALVGGGRWRWAQLSLNFYHRSALNYVSLPPLPFSTHSSIPGHHQLESAQLSIKLRELTSELEARAGEAEASSKELESSHQEELEMVKSQWSREVEDLNRQLKQLEKK